MLQCASDSWPRPAPGKQPHWHAALVCTGQVGGGMGYLPTNPTAPSPYPAPPPPPLRRSSFSGLLTSLPPSERHPTPPWRQNTTELRWPRRRRPALAPGSRAASGGAGCRAGRAVQCPRPAPAPADAPAHLSPPFIMHCYHAQHNPSSSFHVDAPCRCAVACAAPPPFLSPPLQ